MAGLKKTLVVEVPVLFANGTPYCDFHLRYPFTLSQPVAAGDDREFHIEFDHHLENVGMAHIRQTLRFSQFAEADEVRSQAVPVIMSAPENSTTIVVPAPVVNVENTIEGGGPKKITLERSQHGAGPLIGATVEDA